MDWIGLDLIGLDWVKNLKKNSGLDWIGSKVLYINFLQCIPEIITAFVYFVT